MGEIWSSFLDFHQFLCLLMEIKMFPRCDPGQKSVGLLPQPALALRVLVQEPPQQFPVPRAVH